MNRQHEQMPANADTGNSTYSAPRRLRRFNALGSARLKCLALILGCFGGATDVEAEEVFSLALPIRCQPGLTCFFQNYVDHDASDKVRDYNCGGRSYDGHDGTDIRIRNLEVQRQGWKCSPRRRDASSGDETTWKTFRSGPSEKPRSPARNAATASSSSM